MELFVNHFLHLEINTTYLGTNSASFLPSSGKEKKEAAAPEPFPLGRSLVAAAQAGLSALADAASTSSNCLVATGVTGEGVSRLAYRNVVDNGIVP